MSLPRSSVWRTGGIAAALLSLMLPACVPAAEIGAIGGAAVGPVPSGRAEGQFIRVAIAQRKPTVDLAVNGGFQIFTADSALSVRSGPHLSSVTVRGTREGILLGNDLLPNQAVRVEPSRDATIHVNGQRLRGQIEIRRQQDLTLLVINHLDIEDYLRGVISKEAPHYWRMEALKALAIAARTYALAQQQTKAGVDFDVTGDVMSQVYGGREGEKGRTSRAVNDTRGIVLTYQGRLFPAFYHSTCGGRTEHGSVMGPGYDLEPLQGNAACSFCSASPFYRWQQRLSKADVSWALKKHHRGSLWPVDRLEIAERTMTGRVAKVRIRGRHHYVTLSGYDFRQLFGFDGIRSTAFSIVPLGDDFVLEGRGWGHGVGLCQWGAAELARRGLVANEILAFYYPDTRVVRLDEVTSLKNGDP